MTENEQLLGLVNETLECAYQVLAELESNLQAIENPRLDTSNLSKQDIVEKMRMINSVIFAGEKARESLEVNIRRRKR